MKKVEDYVRSIPDFPEPGIIFRDVTSILQDADGLQLAIDEMQHFVEEVDCDVICGTESRGFIFGMPIAYNLHKPFVPIRKKENFLWRPSRRAMTWSTAAQRSRCTKTPSNRVEGSHHRRPDCNRRYRGGLCKNDRAPRRRSNQNRVPDGACRLKRTRKTGKI